MSNYTVQPTFLMGKLGLGKRLEVSATQIVAYSRRGETLTIEMAHVVDFPEHVGGWFGDSLVLRVGTTRLVFRHLRRAELKLLLTRLNHKITLHLSTAVGRAITRFEQQCVQQYLRDSAVHTLDVSVFELVRRYLFNKATWSTSLERTTTQHLERLSSYFPLEKHIQRIREEYERKVMAQRSDFYNTIENFPLTHEQRLAVVRDNDRNLVLAAAGTGKTAVIVAKVLDLVERGQIESSQILVLAFNNAAAKELRERLSQRAVVVGTRIKQLPMVMTFHSLGRTVLNAAGVKTRVSFFEEDPQRLKKWCSEWLRVFLKEHPKLLKDFIELSFSAPAPFEFATIDEYESYIRDTELRTLNGELVKGYQELVIANWLFMNSVDYVYESGYMSKHGAGVDFDYKPDFHIAGTQIYLEHFGIARDGSTRANIDAKQYADAMAMKRQLHLQHGTVLLETYHYDWVEQKLTNRLATLMSEAGVVTKPLAHEQMFNMLNEQGMIASGVDKYLQCLQIIKSEQLDLKSVETRLREANIQQPQIQAKLLWHLVQGYRDELVRQRAIDFDGMINGACEVIKNQSYVPAWSHILVDEFQDISNARMKLLKAC